jgi:hypothetical protein
MDDRHRLTIRHAIERVRRAMPATQTSCRRATYSINSYEVTKPAVTKPADTFVTRFKTSRPTIGDKPLVPAERQRLSRARKAPE